MVIICALTSAPTSLFPACSNAGVRLYVSKALRVVALVTTPAPYLHVDHFGLIGIRILRTCQCFSTFREDCQQERSTISTVRALKVSVPVNTESVCPCQYCQYLSLSIVRALKVSVPVNTLKVSVPVNSESTESVCPCQYITCQYTAGSRESARYGGALR